MQDQPLRVAKISPPNREAANFGEQVCSLVLAAALSVFRSRQLVLMCAVPTHLFYLILRALYANYPW